MRGICLTCGQDHEIGGTHLCLPQMTLRITDATGRDISITPQVFAESMPYVDGSIALTGWVCPRCNSVYAPFMTECWRCNTPGETDAPAQ